MTTTPEAPQPQPPQPAAPPPAGQQPRQTNGLAIAGMVLGIVGLVGLCIWWLGLPCAIVGLILSILGKKKAAVTGVGGGMATAGIVMSIIAIGLGIVGIILIFAGIAWFASEWGKAAKEMETSMRMVKMFLA